MSIQRFRPEIWSANLLVALRSALVYGGPQVVNHDYEGDIAEAGDTVRITSISRPTVQPYVPNVTVINPQQLVDAQRTLVVDQAEYWAFEIDDVDARQAAGNVMPQAMSESAYALATTIDQYLASFYTAAQTVIGSTSAPVSVVASQANSTDVYSKILVPLRTQLSRANVPAQGRYCIVPPEAYAGLLQDTRFIKANEAGTTEGLQNGIVGRAAGFDIYESNNVPVPTTGVYAVTAGVQSAISMAEQINKTEAYRPQSSFADAVKGLALYGAKVIRPDSLAVAYVAVS